MVRCKDNAREVKGGQITAIVVTCNEDDRLDECLLSLGFCDELIVVDLESEDQSVEIAREHGDRIIHHERVPVVEQVRADVIGEASNDWVLFIDPDEVMHRGLLEQAASAIQQEQRVGRVFLPWKFYFRGKPLNGTQWGGEKHKGILIHKDRCELAGHVHRGINLKEGFREIEVPWSDKNCHIKHYWADGYKELFKKHIRYIKEEGKSRFENGAKFSWPSAISRCIYSFLESYVLEEGYRDKLTGIALSIFHTWYEVMSQLEVRKHQKNID